MMWGWWFPGIGFMVLCMVLMVLMMGHHGMSGHHDHESQRRGRQGAERTLDNRLASGEIDVDEYLRLRDVLQRTRESDQGVLPET